MKTDSLIRSTFYLTLAGIITKFLGFAYRIYMSNELGAEGMGLYQLIMPIYFLAWSITSSGITTTISKLTSESIGKIQYDKIKQYFFQCLLITFFVSTSLTIFVFFNASWIATNYIHEPRAIKPIEILSIAFPFMALGSCVRGYFFGLQKSSVPALSQVIEQIFRILVIFLLTANFGKLNIIYAIVGIVVSEFISFLYVIYEYKKNKITYHSKINIFSTTTFLIIISMSLPLTINRILSSFLSTYEHILIPVKLQEFGFDKTTSLAIFGQVTGMALPLIYFPSSMLMAISTSLIPVISKAKASNNINGINNNVNKTMLFTTFSGFWSLTFFVLFSKQLTLLIYNQDFDRILLYLGLLSPFLYLQMVLGGILNGLGKHMTLFFNNILSSIITILSIIYFVPKIGILGFIFGLFISYLFVCTANYQKIKSSCTLKLGILNLTFKPLISSLGTIVILKFFLNNLQFLNKTSIVNLIIGGIIMSSIYLLLIVQTGFITIKDIKKVIQIVKTPIVNLNKNLFY